MSFITPKTFLSLQGGAWGTQGALSARGAQDALSACVPDVFYNSKNLSFSSGGAWGAQGALSARGAQGAQGALSVTCSRCLL